jgi:hypothetical protein
VEPSTDLIPPASADVALTDEERVELWRLETLLRTGYPQTLAEQLAAAHEVDLHQAVELLEHGCNVELAERILL